MIRFLAILFCAGNLFGQASFESLLLLEEEESAPAGPTYTARWKFNEGSGTSAADDTGNGNTGTLTSGTTWGTGPNSNGDAVFDGTDDHVVVAETNFDYERTQAFSVACWIKPHSSSTGVREIVSKIATGGNNPGWTLRWDSVNQRLQVYILQTDGAQLIAAITAINTVLLNTWYHVALTYDGSSSNTGLELYINGANATDLQSGGPLTASILNDNPLWIGKGLADPFYGEIDDVIFDNVDFTAGEVDAIYDALAQ